MPSLSRNSMNLWWSKYKTMYIQCDMYIIYIHTYMYHACFYSAGKCSLWPDTSCSNHLGAPEALLASYGDGRRLYFDEFCILSFTETMIQIHGYMIICIYIFIYMYIFCVYIRRHRYRLRYDWCVLYARVSKKCNHANIIYCNFNEEYEHQSWVGIGCASPEVSLLSLGSCADTEKSLQSHVKEKHSPNYKGFSNTESLQTPWHSYPGCKHSNIAAFTFLCPRKQQSPHWHTIRNENILIHCMLSQNSRASNLIDGLLKSTKKYP